MTKSFDETRFTPEQIAELKASAISPEIVERAGAVRLAKSRMGRPPKLWEGDALPQRTDEYRYIYLTHGKVALVDQDDFGWLSAWSWTAMFAKSGWYAVRGGKGKHVRMHRAILGEPLNIVDHRDGDGLNNTKTNLRVCSNAQNMRNCGLRSTNKSGFKGVFWCTQTQKWVAKICVNYRSMSLGRFDTAEAAARAYDAAALSMHGEFARLNFEVAR
jgi:hypothetical protein